MPSTETEFLEAMGERLRTQDNRMTRAPIWMVEQHIHRVDRWDLVQGAVALTLEGIEEYLRMNGHNLTEPRIYVGSMSRVPEMIRLREILMATDQETP